MNAYEPLVGFKSEKAAQVTAYFLGCAGGSGEKLKLVKLLYIVERESARLRGRPMLYDEYYSLPHGPVCSSSLNGINGGLDKEIWAKYIAKHGQKDVYLVSGASAEENLDQLSHSDLSILKTVWNQFGWMTASQLRNWTHRNCSEYTEIDRGRLPITLSQIATAVGLTDVAQFQSSVSEHRSSEAMFSH